MKTEKLIFAAVILMSFNSVAASISQMADVGTITVKGNVYASGCEGTQQNKNPTVTIPTTYSSDYAKGDTSPESSTKGSKGMIMFKCPNNTGVTIRVEGTAVDTDPTLFKVTPGTGKAEGVGLKVLAQSGVAGSTIKNVVIKPNIENAEVFLANKAGYTPIIFSAQAVATEDKVVAGDLSTTLTWTALYN